MLTSKQYAEMATDYEANPPRADEVTSIEVRIENADFTSRAPEAQR